VGLAALKDKPLSVIEMLARAPRVAAEASEDPLQLPDAMSMRSLELAGTQRPIHGSTVDLADALRSPSVGARGIRPGVLDIVVVPVAASAFVIKTMLRSVLRLIVNVLDWTFPIVMQGARVPLFLLRIIGDVVAAALSALMWLLPLSATRRRELQARIAREWAKLRKNVSYRAFEEALHHAFERGMTWVFRTCRNLSPRSALLVICAAAAWFPITFGTSTVMHAFLLANATTLPAWVQIFHFPVALMAKSKILVLPVYPAAWPQAKRHWLVLRVRELLRRFKRLAVIQRLAHRYRQTEFGADRLGALVADAVVSTGLYRASATTLRYRRDAATWCAGRFRKVSLRVIVQASRLWLIGPHFRGLVTRFSKTAPTRTTKPSEKIRLVYARWAVKFTPSYYEAKERQIAHSTG
jgi:hypothetical protein